MVPSLLLSAALSLAAANAHGGVGVDAEGMTLEGDFSSSAPAAALSANVTAPAAVSAAASSSVRATLYYVTDTAVFGCAQDNADPSAILQVTVSAPGGSVVGQAAYACPWNSAQNGHGFQIQYRQALSAIAGIQVAITSADGSSTTTLTESSAQNVVNNFNRGTSTFLYATPAYQIGISLAYGAAVSEFYNSRIDPTLNLITSDPGAMVQTAYFGSANVFSGSNCVGSTADNYNPTQAGSGCANGPANMQFLGSSVSQCTSSNNNALCGQTEYSSAGPNDANPDWIQFFVHYRNYFYPSGTVDYQPYDDVYGYVKYTFKAEYAQMDIQSWRTNQANQGSSFQQMPISFLNQINQIQTDSMTLTRGASDSRYLNSSKQYDFGSGSEHWIYARAVDNNSALPVASPGDFLTLAYYSALVSSGGNSCPSRQYQAQMFGASSATDQSWIGYENSSEVQNINLAVGLQMYIYYQSRAILSPYRPTESVNGSPLSVLTETPDTNGGAMPSWECNPNGSVATPTAPGSGATTATATATDTSTGSTATDTSESLTPDNDALNDTMNGTDSTVSGSTSSVGPVAISNGTLMICPGLPAALVIGGQRLQLESGAIWGYFATNTQYVSASEYYSVPYAGSILTGATVVGATGSPAAFVSMEGELWPVSCLGAITANSSAISMVSSAQFGAYPVRSSLICQHQ